MKSRTIPRGDTTLDKPDGIPWEIGGFRSTAASGQGTDHEGYEKKS